MRSLSRAHPLEFPTAGTFRAVLVEDEQVRREFAHEHLMPT
jgi:hypothetical protein